MPLFKYVAPDRVDILGTRRIRFTPATDFNDPFEATPHVEAIMPASAGRRSSSEDERKDLEEALRQEAELYGLQRQFELLQRTVLHPASNVDVFSVIDLLGPQLLRHIQPQFGAAFQNWFGDRFGVLSLSERPTSLLMWAHYASSHMGLVIEFDGDHPFFHQQHASRVIGKVMKVVYADDRPAITAYEPGMAHTAPHIERLITQVLLTKGREWEYEREWRMVLPLNDVKAHPHTVMGRIHLFDVPAEAISVVVLGARVSGETATLVRVALDTQQMRHVRLRHAQISKTRYEVVIE